MKFHTIEAYPGSRFFAFKNFQELHKQFFLVFEDFLNQTHTCPPCAKR